MPGALAISGSQFIPRAGSAPLFAETALGGVVGFAGSAACVSAGGADCCDSPHPARSTAAIVVIRRCFIILSLRREFSSIAKCTRNNPVLV
jgi:hypothetical protein